MPDIAVLAMRTKTQNYYSLIELLYLPGGATAVSISCLVMLLEP